VAKVAIFEVESDRLISILDSDGDIDITRGRIIPTVSEKYLNKLIANNPTKVEPPPPISTNDDSTRDDKSVNPTLEEDVDKTEDDLFSVNLPTNRISKEVQDSKEKLKTGVFITNPAIKMPELLEEETQESAKQMRREFISSPTNKWVVNFMENNNYSIVDNEGGGDCFSQSFATRSNR